MTRPTGLRISVQPRACGELFLTSAQNEEEAGSAPRVRGTLRFMIPADREHRFSPARAGNSAQLCRSIAHQPVQPRACGELLTTRRCGNV